MFVYFKANCVLCGALTGLVIYFAYGVWNSDERHRSSVRYRDLKDDSSDDVNPVTSVQQRDVDSINSVADDNVAASGYDPMK